jgi:EmrB/QacA subfamily drug resistance transporter
MGIGGAFIYPTTLSILTNTFVGRERARAIGIWAGVSGIGIALGPLLGGFLLEHYWWGSVFLINVPVCIAALILGRFYIFDSKDPSGKKLDVVGATLSIIGLVGVLYAVIEAPDSGWGAPNVIGGFVFGAIFLALFARWELRSSHPMLELRFFRNPRFSAASMTMTLIYFALFGTTFLLTQYFQFVLGYSPLKSGFMTAAVAIGLMIAAPLAPRFVDSFGTKIVVMAGLLIAGLCMLAYTSQSVLDSLVGGWLVRMAYGAGIGLIAAPVTESIMGALPPAQAGVGSAVNDTTRQTGGALGVAILGSIVAAKYHALIDAGRATIPPASYAKVHDSIGRAVDAASRLAKSDAAAAQRVLHLSFNAFFKASQIAYLVGTGIVVLAMFICGRYLPKEAEPIEDIAIADAIEPMIE